MLSCQPPQCWLFFEVCSGRPFLYSLHVPYISKLNNTTQRHLRMSLVWCFFWGAAGGLF
nr:MAG TPA: hypothetical protein [Caudoviricetes sp.]